MKLGSVPVSAFGKTCSSPAPCAERGPLHSVRNDIGNASAGVKKHFHASVVTNERQHACIDSDAFAATKLQFDCMDFGAYVATFGLYVRIGIKGASTPGKIMRTHLYLLHVVFLLSLHILHPIRNYLIVRLLRPPFLEIDGDTSELTAALVATPKLIVHFIRFDRTSTPTSVLEIDVDTSELYATHIATPKL